MATVVYTYKNCSTCRKATAFLRAKGVAFEERPIREVPPSREELHLMLARYEGVIRKLFNTSGQDYRALDLKEKLPAMSSDEAIELLAGNGNLVKRPFLLTGSSGATGFDEEDWEKLLSRSR